jgi:hypothetical protein
MGSDEPDELALGLAVALNVTFSRREVPVAGKLLYVF